MNATTGSVDIRPILIDDIDRLEPLWKKLHDHHADRWPQERLRSADESWSRRRAKYEQWLSGPETVALAAVDGHEFVGYAVAREVAGLASWPTGDRVAQVESLYVVPSARSRGVGVTLPAALREELRRRGLHDVLATVLMSNDHAKSFFEAAGLTPLFITYRGLI
jgi:ribosomal protein S18 acetylase RimI-like enzyme